MKNPVIAALSYALFQTFASLGARRLSDIMFLVSGTASIVFFTLLVIVYEVRKGTEFGKTDITGLLFVFIANAAITIFTLFLGRSFQSFDSKFVIPFVFGGAILVSSIIIFVMNKTIPSLYEATSLLLISGGLFMLSFNYIK